MSFEYGSVNHFIPYFPIPSRILFELCRRTQWFVRRFFSKRAAELEPDRVVRGAALSPVAPIRSLRSAKCRTPTIQAALSRRVAIETPTWLAYPRPSLTGIADAALQNESLLSLDHKSQSP